MFNECGLQRYLEILSSIILVGKKGEKLESKTLRAKALRDVRTEKGSFFFANTEIGKVCIFPDCLETVTNNLYSWPAEKEDDKERISRNLKNAFNTQILVSRLCRISISYY